ncbi:MAG: prepilin-type N-terminal cleavage/methylation domain-containing protein [Candidatus Omnitrophota bacterium]|nr:prepilin-type N-terminal cleavage/methylation domain-containing protein [Candidatus Omnitrophota bacterium]
MRCNRAFSLLEVIITVAVFSTALVFVLRAFTTVLFGARLSQDMTLACLAAENKLWEIEQAPSTGAAYPDKEGAQVIQDREFKWSYELFPSSYALLSELDLAISWRQHAGREAKVDIATYLKIK